jgi:hypothetical protein
MLAASSNVFNTLSGADASTSAGAGREDVSNVGKGFLEGGKVLGKTLFNGVTGGSGGGVVWGGVQREVHAGVVIKPAAALLVCPLLLPSSSARCCCPLLLPPCAPLHPWQAL